ncbi:diphthine--ammonia ligase KNAG_0A02870 [Huiozyma naganishii CBS 8797]|uniref:Diphthine--ammonia ligase n=1 Tax=Huiozyma naganishii (strain ATCC MYA-139 / BCRC 22969 / CBS 8797 / KCTC 17520 / NBRC 10181 / NCYC 3082 / Yp74L-3) TaxID=1071383 RepID=J7S3H6_HUIN7|nr:hypothetical protein KNAG_0A02870 [Kazachstania naganishii CBS 8797]CCK67976.1 hypothetical protein KNAG_0A02870 [Kazachstania naganishii CBS 8797]
MKFVALISGGKDSCYNILHCLKQGHELAALGNLYPESRVQELDSFMFQTIGFDIVQFYERCCGVPLFTHTISLGGSKNVSMNYIKTKDDEIEDLYQLLSKVKTAIPTLEAVSVGAILSSYQRNRVENVCIRLGLQVLSYLWQRDQGELMDEMCSMSRDVLEEGYCGKLDARLIKVAAIGLDESHLLKSLPQINPVMKKLNKMYDVNICGEGGEFETMVFDAPFFKNGFLKIVNSKNTTEDNGGVCNALIKVEFTERKLPDTFLQNELQRLPQPLLFDEKWSALLQCVEQMDVCKSVEKEKLSPSPRSQTVDSCNVADAGGLLFISNITSRKVGEDTTIEEQTRDIFAQVDDILSAKQLYPSQTISSSLILSDMTTFARVNHIYNSWFSTEKWGSLPPSRACVGSSALPSGILLQLSLVIDQTRDTVVDADNGAKINQNKDGLHVQGISYWAPCNIGPYSQATWLESDQDNRVARISGQIALIPSSMELLRMDKAAEQSVLALRHFDSVKSAIDSKRQLSMICFVTKSEMIDIVRKTWSLYCSEMGYESELWTNKPDDDETCLIVVKVSQLPRSALCEWSGICCKNTEAFHADEEDEEEDEEKSETKLSGSFAQLNLNATSMHNILVQRGRRNNCNFITGFTNVEEDLVKMLDGAEGSHIVLYYNPSSISVEKVAEYHNVELYPVQNIYSVQGQPFKYAFHVEQY